MTKGWLPDIYILLNDYSLTEIIIAPNVFDKIGEAILKLEKMPFRNAIVVDERLAHQGIRKMMIDNNIIFYIVNEEARTITIVRILYAKRDWINLL